MAVATCISGTMHASIFVLLVCLALNLPSARAGLADMPKSRQKGLKKTKAPESPPATVTSSGEAPVPESPYTSAFLKHKDDPPPGPQIQDDAKRARARVGAMLNLTGVGDEIRASEGHEKIVFARRVPGFTPTG